MVVYIEYAFMVNFLLDGLLLYLALKCARAKVCFWKLVLSAAVGGVEALVFPLLTLPVWCSYLIKLLGGVLLAVLVVSRGSPKTYLIVTLVFFALTFLFGGMLTAIYSFFSIPYAEGQGYILESAPLTLVFVSAGILSVVTVKIANTLYRYRGIKRNILPCKLRAGDRTVSWQGLADSGNCLFFRGEPVCVVSAMGALALFRKCEPVGRMTVSTVNGSRESPVFVCELETEGINRNCFVTVGEITSKEYQLILHTAFLEGAHERIDCIKGMVKKVRGK